MTISRTELYIICPSASARVSHENYIQFFYSHHLKQNKISIILYTSSANGPPMTKIISELLRETNCTLPVSERCTTLAPKLSHTNLPQKQIQRKLANNIDISVALRDAVFSAVSLHFYLDMTCGSAPMTRRSSASIQTLRSLAEGRRVDKRVTHARTWLHRSRIKHT